MTNPRRRSGPSSRTGSKLRRRFLSDRRARIRAYEVPIHSDIPSIADLVSLARAGNVAAGRRLIAFAAARMGTGQPLEPLLEAWVAERLAAAAANPAKAGQELRVAHRRGRPADHSDSVEKAWQSEYVRRLGAWRAFSANALGDAPFAENCAGAPTAFTVASEWLAARGFVNEHGQPFSPATIEGWFEERREFIGSMDRALSGVMSCFLPDPSWLASIEVVPPVGDVVDRHQRVYTEFVGDGSDGRNLHDLDDSEPGDRDDPA